jgi:hypothetical protein
LKYGSVLYLNYNPENMKYIEFKLFKVNDKFIKEVLGDEVEENDEKNNKDEIDEKKE